MGVPNIMEKIVEYKTLYMAKGGIDRTVNEMINQGWQPYGYQFDGGEDKLNGGGRLVAQVMVRYGL